MYEKLIEALRYAYKTATESLSNPYRFCAYYAAAADAIEDLENKLNLWRHDKIFRWISVTERLPEEDKLVLVWRNNRLPYVSRRIDTSYWVGLGRDAEVTHWMPLPKPPKEETK